MSLTDEIYAELKEGLWTGLDYGQLRLKYEKSKGPFYNALQMVIADARAEITKLSSEFKGLTKNCEEERTKLRSLADQQQKAVDGVKARQEEIEALEREEETVRAKIQELNAEVNRATGLLNRVKELEKMGFDSGRLQTLRDVICDVGTRRGLKPKESVDRFFADLEDYDAKAGLEQEVERLNAVIRTKRLDADRWRSESENLEGRHKELREAISIIQCLAKQGVKPEQIVLWHNALTTIGGIEQFEKELKKYMPIQRLLLNKKKEIRALEKDKAVLAGELKELREQKAQVEGSIRAVTESGIRQIEKAGQAVADQLKEIRSQAEAEVSNYLGQFDRVVQKAYEVGARVGQAEEQLKQLDKVKEAILSHEAPEEQK